MPDRQPGYAGRVIVTAMWLRALGDLDLILGRRATINELCDEAERIIAEAEAAPAGAITWVGAKP